MLDVSCIVIVLVHVREDLGATIVCLFVCLFVCT